MRGPLHRVGWPCHPLRPEDQRRGLRSATGCGPLHERRRRQLHHCVGGPRRFCRPRNRGGVRKRRRGLWLSTRGGVFALACVCLVRLLLARRPCPVRLKLCVVLRGPNGQVLDGGGRVFWGGACISVAAFGTEGRLLPRGSQASRVVVFSAAATSTAAALRAGVDSPWRPSQQENSATLAFFSATAWVMDSI